MIVISGHIGSDAGYTWIDGHGVVHHSPGWGVDAMKEVSAAINVSSEAARFRTPGLANEVAGKLAHFVTRELEGNVNKEASVVILGGAPSQH